MISLRDHFASAALTGLVGSFSVPAEAVMAAPGVAEDAFRIADAMLSERGREHAAAKASELEQAVRALLHEPAVVRALMQAERPELLKRLADALESAAGLHPISAAPTQDPTQSIEEQSR